MTSFFKKSVKPTSESVKQVAARPRGLLSDGWITTSKAKHSAEMVAQINACLREGVGEARGLLLLQTAGVFTHPISLLEMYCATRRGLPIVCLRLEGGSYEFEMARPFLQDLESNLNAHSPLDASVVAAWLDAHMISFTHVAISCCTSCSCACCACTCDCSCACDVAAATAASICAWTFAPVETACEWSRRPLLTARPLPVAMLLLPLPLLLMLRLRLCCSACACACA